MTLQIGTQITEPAFNLADFIAANGLTQTSFFFRAIKDSEGKIVTFGKDVKGNDIEKRPQFECGLPFIQGEFIYNVLADETIEQDKKLRMLKYLADAHNSNVESTAQQQINAAIKNDIRVSLSQDVINLPELDFWALVFKEPVDRKKFSDELIASAIEDFKTVGAVHFKRANGEAVPAQNIINTAKEIFENKFKITKTDKRALQLFQTYLAIWFENSSAQANFTALASDLQEKIDRYLNPSNESKIGAFE